RDEERVSTAQSKPGGEPFGTPVGHAIEGDHAPGRNVEPRPDLPVMGEPGLLQEAHAAGGKLIRVALSPRPVRTHAVPGTIRRVAHRFLLWSPHRASRAVQ